FVDVEGSAPEEVAQICAILKKTAGLHELRLRMHGSKLVLEGQRDNALALAEKERIVESDEAVRLPLDHPSESARQVVNALGRKRPRAQTERTAYPLRVLQV